MDNNNNKAVVSFICGISGLVINCLSCCCCLGYMGFPVSVCAIIFAMLDKSENGGRFNGMATAGFVMGIVGATLYIISYVAAFVLGFTGEFLSAIS